MPWGRCDDSFYDHAKVRAIRPEIRNSACGLYWRSISLCNRMLSDGRITEFDLPTIDATDAEVSELVRVKLWQKAGKGWRVHDFLVFNDSREKVEARRVTKTEAGRAGGVQSGRARRSKRLSKPEAPAAQFVELPTQPRPDPSASIEASTPKPPFDEGDDDHLDAWYRLTGSWPNDKVVPWLNQLADDHGSAALSRALAEETKADPARNTLISRTRNRLERGAHLAAKAAEERRKERDRAALAEIETMPVEQREENMRRLREEMAKSGLLPVA